MDGNGSSYVVWNCFRVLTGLCAANNLCKNAGYAQCDFCLQFCAVEICVPEPECDICNPPPPPAGGTGSNNNGNGQSPGPNGTGGGSPNPNDYVPLNCNPDPNYVDPHIVNADGSMSVPACSDIPIPYPPNTPNPTNNPLTATQFLLQNLSLTPNQIDFVNTHTDESNVIATMFSEDINLSENKAIAEAFIEHFAEDVNNPSTGVKLEGLKTIIKNAITQGVVETAKLMRKVYLTLNLLAKDNPAVITQINSNIINPIRGSLNVNLNPQTLEWRDLFNIWLFELGSYSLLVDSSPAISISQGATVIIGDTFYMNALKDMPSIFDLRDSVRNQLKINNVSVGYTTFNRYGYNVNEYYDSLIWQSTAKIFLGSFRTDAYVLSKSGNSATILFVMKNVSGWESATRFIKASRGNTSIIDNKPRGTGLNLGGNFGQDIQWTETITW